MSLAVTEDVAGFVNTRELTPCLLVGLKSKYWPFPSIINDIDQCNGLPMNGDLLKELKE